MPDFTGYRTIIFLVISLVLKALVLKGVLHTGTDSQSNAEAITNVVLILASGVADLAGIWFKLKSPAPGPLSEEGKALKVARLAAAKNPPK